ncbi:hypothetical protein PVAP13_1NG309657 [Panicum virgatum]|uniref:Uncharacterized protein n=1 Tax=Panicum virgatum TaxID=38727 RepID=A0A8T0WZ72_PANVG|nr:hypothetical protein PVAP13_1NG309657 [Panicum virgatum]
MWMIASPKALPASSASASPSLLCGSPLAPSNPLEKMCSHLLFRGAASRIGPQMFYALCRVTPEMGEAHGSNWRGRAEEAPEQKACQRRNLVGGSGDGGRYSGWIPSLRSVEGAPATCGAASAAEPI